MDTDTFKSEYKKTLKQEIASHVPSFILDAYDAESCMAYTDKKEIYVVRRKSDSMLGLLRISNDDALQNPISEARLLEKLDHPAIPKVFLTHTEDEKRYLVREYFEGQTLHTLVKSGGVLLVKDVLDIAAQMCDILQYLHEQEPSVIHRDIKPENIVMTPIGEIKLIDFGIARKFQENAENDTMAIGSRPYMATEQFGSAQTDGRSDIYSLGMVMLFLSTGTPIRNNLENIQHKGLAKVIGTCIEFAPNSRFQSAILLKANIHMAKHWQLARIRRNFPKLAGIAVAVLIMTVLIVLFGHNSKTLRSTSVELKESLIAQVVRQRNNLETDEQIKQVDIQRSQSPLRIIGNVPSPIDESIYIVDCQYEYYTSGIRISTRGDIATLEDIKEMTGLLELGLIYQRITDISDISALRLRMLDIDNNNVRDISPLAGMDSLTGLFLSENPIDSIESISGLKNLVELDISTTKVSDLSPLAGLEKLALLIMRRVPVTDLSVFDHLPALNEISMTSVIAEDFAPVRRHQGWQRLDVSFTNMENPLDIEYTDQMVVLNVGGTSLASLHGIERFTELTELWIHETDIQSLDGLENLHNLQNLYLHYTEVSDISPIAGLANLREIDVGYTRITDLTPLLGRKRSLTIICSGLSEEVLAPMRGQPNIILDY